MQRECSGSTKGGAPCRSFALSGSDFCISHGDRVIELAEYRRRGGKAKTNRARALKELPAEPMTTAELHSWLGVAFKRTLAGKMVPNVATALSNVAKTMTELQRAGVMEDRLSEIERRLGAKVS